MEDIKILQVGAVQLDIILRRKERIAVILLYIRGHRTFTE